MSVYYEDDNNPYYSGKHLVNEVCALSGQPVEFPFMVWRGLCRGSPNEVFINAASLGSLRTNTASFLHDFIEILHAATLTKKDGALSRTRCRRGGDDG